jgi:hypothetical protein
MGSAVFVQEFNEASFRTSAFIGNRGLVIAFGEELDSRETRNIELIADVTFGIGINFGNDTLSKQAVKIRI